MDFEEYMKAQIHWLEVEKWLEGERRGSDPGQEFLLELIRKSGEEFRRNYIAAHSADQSQGDELSE